MQMGSCGGCGHIDIPAEKGWWPVHTTGHQITNSTTIPPTPGRGLTRLGVTNTSHPEESGLKSDVKMVASTPSKVFGGKQRKAGQELLREARPTTEFLPPVEECACPFLLDGG